MQVIWFKSINGNTVSREFGTVAEAQEHWDRLEWAGYHMVSARP